MFDFDSNMHLIANRYDDWQIRLSNDLKSQAVELLKDNRNWKREFYLKCYNACSGQFWSFKDLKRTISRIIIHTIWDSFTWSIGPNTDYRSHIKSDFYFRQYCEFLEWDSVQITKFCQTNELQLENESIVKFSGNNIVLFEKPSAKLFMNAANIQRN